MAAGENYFSCTNQELLEHVLRKMIYIDENGKPILHTDPNGTALEPYYTCENMNVPLELVFREMILEDANGEPFLNTTS